MRTTFIPSTNHGLVIWSRNLVTRLSTQAGHFGVPPARLATLADRQAEYAEAQAVATRESSRSATSDRNDARAALLAEVRGVVAILRAQQDLSDGQKVLLGLTVPNQRRKVIPRPSIAPRIMVRSVVGHRVNLLLIDQQADRLRRPCDVAGAAIYLHVGEKPSDDRQKWHHVGNATRARHLVKLPSNLPPGTKFWLAAAWYNARAQLGPASTPASGWIQFGGPMEMAA
jgi:hypothetical protein